MYSQINDRTRLLMAVLFLSTMLMLISCAINQPIATQVKSQSMVMLDTYHAAFVDVRDTLNNPVSTPAQRSLALQKRAILVKIWNILGPYEDLINKGGSPGVDDTKEINALIGQLTSLATSTIQH